MTGANAGTPELFRGRLLLNLDSEEDDVLYIGCAGGCDANLTWEFTKSAAGDQEHARVTVSGLRGGHSGGDIHENRANANKLLVRTLLGAGCDNLRLCTIAGGSKRNAIPREAHAEICVPQGLIHALRQSAERVCAETRAESGESNPSIRVEPPTKPAGPAASPADTTRLLRALAAIPSGVLGMHPKATDLVETSNNLSTIASSSDGPADLLRITAGTLTRSSCESRLDEVLQQIEAVGRLSGAKITTANRYPGWDPDPDAPLVGICRRVYAKQFGAPPKVAAIHAGLECGIIGRQVKPIQMISFGPRIAGAHSPDECVWVESVAKVWRYLQAVLKSVAEPERHSEKKDGEAVNIGSISRRPKC
jgi:dipeptidase D